LANKAAWKEKPPKRGAPNVTSPTRFSITAAGIALLFSSLTAAAQNAPPNPP
jgi:hypothetical protein